RRHASRKSDRQCGRAEIFAERCKNPTTSSANGNRFRQLTARGRIRLPGLGATGRNRLARGQPTLGAGMPSGVLDSVLLKHIWGSEELRGVFSDENRVQQWYDYEAALALAQAELGIIPRAAAGEIAAKAKVGNVDLAEIAAEIRRTKHPLVPALRALQA